MKNRHAPPRNSTPISRSRGSSARLPKRSSAQSLVYPFAAIVGQEDMKLALVLNVIDPSIGGVLIMGHRGTGKSTAVRALADLLPDMSIVPGCSYQCDPADGSSLCSDCKRRLASGEKFKHQRSPRPIVDLPLGATEDRVCGTIDIERALRQGTKTFEPGLLARANRGLLYIDEVNLLDDHLVDVLLDVAVTGVNKVEREGISIQHPARFVLIGSGNPEEGELRPQLLDRFGLHVEVKTDHDLDRRVDIVERRNAFESDPEEFCANLAQDQEQLRNKITRAQKNSGSVIVERPLLRQVAQLCTALKVDGHRGELTITRAGRALAALQGRKKVAEEDVKRVAAMALRHRLRRDALDENASTEQIQRALDRVFAKVGGRVRDDGGEGDGSSSDDRIDKRRRRPAKTGDDGGPAITPNRNLSGTPNGSHGTDAAKQLSASAVGSDLPKVRSEKESKNDRSGTKSRMRSSRATGLKKPVYDHERGRYARSVSSKTKSAKLALDATLRAAAGVGFRLCVVGQRVDMTPDTRHVIPPSTLRFKLFKRKQGRLFIFAIDLSGSMALNRISHVKGVMHALLRESYIKRDSVAIVGFRGTSAELLLPPSRSILRARRVFDSLSVGGGTPLSAGLMCAIDLARRAATQSSGDIALLLFTDGHANVALRTRGMKDRAARRRLIEGEVKRLGSEMRKAGIDPVVVDIQDAFMPTGDALGLAENLGARYFQVRRSHELSAVDSHWAQT